jgi:excisionase family DNA binding protein
LNLIPVSGVPSDDVLAFPASAAFRRRKTGMSKMEAAKAPDPVPLAYTIKNACRLLSVSRSTLYAMASKGELRLVKISGRTLLPASEIARLLGDGRVG